MVYRYSPGAQWSSEHSPDPRPVRAQDRSLDRLEQGRMALASQPLLPTASRRTSAVAACPHRSRRTLMRARAVRATTQPRPSGRSHSARGRAGTARATTFSGRLSHFASNRPICLAVASEPVRDPRSQPPASMSVVTMGLPSLVPWRSVHRYAQGVRRSTGFRHWCSKSWRRIRSAVTCSPPQSA